MPIFTAILLIVFLIVVINIIASAQRPAQILFVHAVLFLAGLLLAVSGLLLFAVPDVAETLLAPAESLSIALDAHAIGASLLLMGIWGVLASLGPVRRLLARVMPLNPASPVHSLALFLAGLLVGNTFFTLAQGGLEALETTAVSVPISTVVLQQVGFVILAFAGIGTFVRRDWRASLTRLGLTRPTAPHLRTGLRWMFALLAVQWAIGLAWTLIDPDQAALLNSVNESFLGEIDSAGEWFTLALAAGTGEETLFRGALQPVLGLGATAVLFAIVHVQYGITPVTFAVFLLGLMLGILRQRTSTTVAILAHFGYNLILGMLSLLAAYAAQFAP